MKNNKRKISDVDSDDNLIRNFVNFPICNNLSCSNTILTKSDKDAYFMSGVCSQCFHTTIEKNKEIRPKLTLQIQQKILSSSDSSDKR